MEDSIYVFIQNALNKKQSLPNVLAYVEVFISLQVWNCSLHNGFWKKSLINCIKTALKI